MGVGAVIGFLFGGWTELLTAILVVQGVDIVTGVLVGGMKKEINSKKMSAGVNKKIGGWLGLILAHVADKVLFDGQSIAVTGLAFTLIGGEGLSVIENLGVLGVPIPDFISGRFEQIQDQGKIGEFE